MTLAAVVLAGGESRRMGRPKATLDWHGTPLVQHVVQTIEQFVDGPVVIVAAPDQALPPLDAEIVRDAREGRGPAEGLAAGLTALRARADAVFVTGVDMPFVGAELIRRLSDAWEPGTIAVPVVNGRRQPLGAIYATSIEPRGSSLRAVLDAARVIELPADDLAAALRDLDDPDDYAEAISRS